MTLKDNLVAYFKLDESSGNATDSVGGLTATNNGTVTYAAGKINNGADFGSTNTTKYFSVADNAVLDFTTAFTISFWFKSTTGSGTFRTLISKGQGAAWTTPFWRYGIRINDMNELETWVEVPANGLTTTSTGGSFTADSVWKHVVVRFDQLTVKIYVNGTEGASVTNNSTITNSNEPLTIGNRSHTDPGEYLSGMIDEVGLWSRALTTTEITALYNSGNGFQYPFSQANMLAFF